MDPKKLVEFLGHSSIYEPFDDYLLSIGIKKRPKHDSTSGGRYPIKHPSLGLELGFETSIGYQEESLVPQKSAGQFVLDSVIFRKQPDLPLPYGLSFSLVRSQVDSIIGPCVQRRPDDDSSTHFFQGVLVDIGWDRNGKMDSILFGYPHTYDQKHLNLGQPLSKV